MNPLAGELADVQEALREAFISPCVAIEKPQSSEGIALPLSFGYSKGSGQHPRSIRQAD